MDMETEQDEESGARVVVGVDFGTTFSGFAFCHKADPHKIHTFYEWPNQVKGGSKPYCKTQTSLHYVRKKDSHGPPSSLRDSDYELKSWGWSAQVDYLEALQAASRKSGGRNFDDWVPKKVVEGEENGQDLQQEVGYFVKRFKVRLASRLPQNDRSSRHSKPWVVKQERPLVSSNHSSRGTTIRLSAMQLTRRIFGVRHSPKSDRQVEEWESIKLELEGQRRQDLLLPATQAGDFRSSPNVLDELPPGMTVERAISDYLSKMVDFIIEHLQQTYGKQLSKRDVQWCLTVPAIWDDRAKQHMRSCAEKAGMVTGLFCPEESAPFASSYPLKIILESEAASVYCVTKSKQTGLSKGSQFLVADVGGGTADIVVHVKQNDDDMDRLIIHEAKQSTGGLCGGSHVDQNFLDFLSHKIGCFDDYVVQNPTLVPLILRRWEEIKCTFDGSPTWDQCVDFEVPRKLAAAWESHETEKRKLGLVPAGQKTAANYDELNITCSEMKMIFDPVIDEILELIRAQMSADIKVLMMVGGFSASPYLRRRLKGAFGLQVEEIICPPDPGSAICQGAVVMGASPRSIITSRIVKRTYGIATFRNTSSMDPPGSKVLCDGKWRCRDGFHIFVRKGDRLGIDHCVKQCYVPALQDQKGIRFDLFSSTSATPVYVTEPGVQLEGSFLFDISHDPSSLGKLRSVCISMYFGRSCIEVRAQRQNFGNVDEVVQLDPLGGNADPLVQSSGELQMLIPM